jgi:hypothetical protein
MLEILERINADGPQRIPPLCVDPESQQGTYLF